jgi:hypothetical protein
MLQHPVDDVDQAAHHAHQGLFLGLALGDLPVVVIVENRIAGLLRHFGHLHLLDGQEIEDAVQLRQPRMGLVPAALGTARRPGPVALLALLVASGRQGCTGQGRYGSTDRGDSRCNWDKAIGSSNGNQCLGA